ncbi:nuclear transport factor 2 family protein [Planctomonas sp. JC2975]|uniref:YybH family protein n=1 Tax=Planctomonas sp. JC2975 TaxID=2729626 RepID=UPI0014758A37|nr:nuclear transport factor 2 family protein [Planctomonas sp. JC2975]NNC12863.1 nuclear transport factor 2 family protein [Planctomonas sp. JC2975]
MTDRDPREHAVRPEDLSGLFVDRANAGDVDGVVELYEPSAVLALPDGRTATGAKQIRRFYSQLLADRPAFTPGPQRPALRNGDLALTSTRTPVGATTEVARRQADGTWRWVMDQPNVLSD